MKYALSSEFKNNFKKAYINLYNLHPSAEEKDFRFRYLKVDWFFPNHINNVINQIKLIGRNHFQDVDLAVSLYGGLFHDAGLVYNRESADPKGHEIRSIEYAKKELSGFGYSDDFIEKVAECIKATDSNSVSTIPEAVLVRNADAYAHLMSMHFFAKANFAQDIHVFIDWFEDKIRKSQSKITVPELKNELEPLINYYERMIKNYRFNKDSKDFLGGVVNDL